MKRKVLSVTRDDCEWIYAKGSGAGGQHRNKTATDVTVRHKPSGAMGHSCDTKHQFQNRQLAFRRMAETKEFQFWIKRQASKNTILTEEEILALVEEQMLASNLRVEVMKDNKWQDIESGP